jgi:hypothetical protein
MNPPAAGLAGSSNLTLLDDSGSFSLAEFAGFK